MISIKQRVFKIISQVLEISAEEVNEESSPETLENWDSLKHMNIVMALEEEFDVEFTEDQIVELLNVRLVIMTLEEILSESKAIQSDVA